MPASSGAAWQGGASRGGQWKKKKRERGRAAAARAQPGQLAEAETGASPEKTSPEGRAERGSTVVWLSPPNRRRPLARPTHTPASACSGRHRGGASPGLQLLQRRRAASEGSQVAKASLEPTATMPLPQCWAKQPGRNWSPVA